MKNRIKAISLENCIKELRNRGLFKSIYFVLKIAVFALLGLFIIKALPRILSTLILMGQLIYVFKKTLDKSPSLQTSNGSSDSYCAAVNNPQDSKETATKKESKTAQLIEKEVTITSQTPISPSPQNANAILDVSEANDWVNQYETQQTDSEQPRTVVSNEENSSELMNQSSNHLEETTEEDVESRIWIKEYNTNATRRIKSILNHLTQETSLLPLIIASL